MLEDPTLQCNHLIIDALDECTTDRSLLLSLIQDLSAKSCIKWIVSTRWPDIEERLHDAGQGVRLSLELNAKSVSEAVRIYIQHKTSQLSQRERSIMTKLETLCKTICPLMRMILSSGWL